MHKSLSDYFNRSYEMDFSALQDEMDAMAFEGDWQPLVRRIAAAYKENSSIRDSIRGEHNLQGFFKAYLALNPFYLVEPEIELNFCVGLRGTGVDNPDDYSVAENVTGVRLKARATGKLSTTSLMLASKVRQQGEYIKPGTTVVEDPEPDDDTTGGGTETLG